MHLVSGLLFPISPVNKGNNYIINNKRADSFSAAVRDNSNSNRSKNPGRNKNKNNKQRVSGSNKRKQQAAERPAVKEAQAKPAKTTPAAPTETKTKKKPTPEKVAERTDAQSATNSSSSSNPQCNIENRAPSRLCKTTYNTTAPMYGVSLTSGQPVTIVQKFPDLLQQVVYETCE